MRELVVDGRRISDDGDVYVIAEVGHNHQGSLVKAIEFLDAAKQCGVDAVKLQKRHNRTLFTRAMYEQPYDHENSFGRTYGEHREALELSDKDWFELMHQAREIGITLFGTSFDAASADFLAELGAPAFKIASADLVNTPLLRRVASYGKPIFLSTGGVKQVDRLDARPLVVVADLGNDVAVALVRDPLAVDYELSHAPPSPLPSDGTRTIRRCSHSRP